MNAANTKVMFISVKKTLITDGMMKKIQGAGMNPFYVQNAEQLTACADKEFGPIVYYMNDDRSVWEALHAALYELCEKRDKRVICIGTNDQRHAFLEGFRQNRVADFFERPMNMERFLERLSDSSDTAAKKKRILIVDDDASYRNLVREWLKEKYAVSMANGGAQAITILSKQECNLILLDYEMPVASGPQVMERIRAIPEAARIPIIFLTGKDDEESIRKVLSLNAQGYLLKTVNEATLLKKVEDVLAAAL